MVKGKVFYFVVKPGKVRELEVKLINMGYLSEPEPPMYVDRYVLGKLKPGQESLAKGHYPKRGEEIDGFVEFSKEVDIENEEDLKFILKATALCIPFEEDPQQFNCFKAFQIKRDRTISIFNCKTRCGFKAEELSADD